MIAGCGGLGRSGPPAATLVLDFTPNPVHAGIYSALAHRYDIRAGVRLRVIAPTASTDSIKLLESGRATFAILDIHDLAIARERGAPVVGVMAIVERPLAAVIAEPRVVSPRGLAGRTVGVSGLPSDTAVLDSVVSGAGGNPARLHPITIGFNAVPDLLAGKVAAATGFWSDEGIALSRKRPGFHSFRVDDFGAPRYPELVLCTTAAVVRRERALAVAVVRALRRGYQVASARDLERQVQGLDPALADAQLAALRPAFRAPDGRIGVLGTTVLRRWARWEARFGITHRPPDVQRLFDTSLSTS